MISVPLSREIDGETLHPVMGYRWQLYLLSAESEAAYASGLGYWTVSRVDPGTLTVSYVVRALSLGDALTYAKADLARRNADAGVRVARTRTCP